MLRLADRSQSMLANILVLQSMTAELSYYTICDAFCQETFFRRASTLPPE
jgi:hypothetical protein